MHQAREGHKRGRGRKKVKKMHHDGGTDAMGVAWGGGEVGWPIHGDTVIRDSRLMVAGGKCHASGYSSAPVISVVTQLVNTHSVAYWHSVIYWYWRLAPLLNYLFSFPWLPVLAEPNFQKRASLPNNLASNSFQWQCFAWPMFETPLTSSGSNRPGV